MYSRYDDEEFDYYYWLEIATGDNGKDKMEHDAVTPRMIKTWNAVNNGYIYSLVPIKDMVMARLVG